MAGKYQLRILLPVMMMYCGTSFAVEKTVSTYLQYRTAIVNNNHGLLKNAVVTKPTATTNMASSAKLVMLGNMGPASFLISANMMPAFEANTTSVAQGTLKLGDMLSLTAGQGLVKWAGYLFANWDFQDVTGTESGYLLIHGPIKSFGLVPLIQADVVAGPANVTIQLIDDVVKDTSVAGAEASMRYNDASKQPIPVFQVSGTFGPVTPQVQFFKYDMGHSTYMSFGAKAQVADLTAFFTYIMDSRAQKVGTQAKKNDYSVMALEAHYKLPAVTARFTYNMMNVKRANGLTANIVGQVKGYDFNEQNESRLGLGAELETFNILCKPYVEMFMESGKFYKGLPTGPTETRSQMKMLLGIKGMI